MKMDFSLPSLYPVLTLGLCVRLLRPISPGVKFNAPALLSSAFKSFFSPLLILCWQHKVLNDQTGTVICSAWWSWWQVPAEQYKSSLNPARLWSSRVCTLFGLCASKRLWRSFFVLGNVWSSTFINCVPQPANKLACVHKGAFLATLSVQLRLIGVSVAREKLSGRRCV